MCWPRSMRRSSLLDADKRPYDVWPETMVGPDGAKRVAWAWTWKGKTSYNRYEAGVIADMPVAKRVVYPIARYKEDLFAGYPRNSFGAGGTHAAEDCAWFRDGCGYYAIADGVVRMVQGAGGDWGFLIVTEHLLEDGSYVTGVYGHAGFDVLVKPGDIIRCGQRIASQGLSCSVENGGYGAHIHFGLGDGPFRRPAGLAQGETVEVEGESSPATILRFRLRPTPPVAGRARPTPCAWPMEASGRSPRPRRALRSRSGGSRPTWPSAGVGSIPRRGWWSAPTSSAFRLLLGHAQQHVSCARRDVCELRGARARRTLQHVERVVPRCESAQREVAIAIHGGLDLLDLGSRQDLRGPIGIQARHTALDAETGAQDEFKVRARRKHPLEHGVALPLGIRHDQGALFTAECGQFEAPILGDQGEGGVPVPVTGEPDPKPRYVLAPHVTCEAGCGTECEADARGGCPQRARRAAPPSPVGFDLDAPGGGCFGCEGEGPCGICLRALDALGPHQAAQQHAGSRHGPPERIHHMAAKRRTGAHDHAHLPVPLMDVRHLRRADAVQTICVVKRQATHAATRHSRQVKAAGGVGSRHRRRALEVAVDADALKPLAARVEHLSCDMPCVEECDAQRRRAQRDDLLRRSRIALWRAHHDHLPLRACHKSGDNEVPLCI